MADCASLERMCAGNGTEGSNPSLSANIDQLPRIICQFEMTNLANNYAVDVQNHSVQEPPSGALLLAAFTSD